ncbi:hypothetical protein [Paracoccus sp. SSK6]|uniref:hypothetical protein n=1 Tax=Paracoccus sp. SSK6 TaxID=3143131 RepID=UPI00321AADB3
MTNRLRGQTQAFIRQQVKGDASAFAVSHRAIARGIDEAGEIGIGGDRCRHQERIDPDLDRGL